MNAMNRTVEDIDRDIQQANLYVGSNSIDVQLIALAWLRDLIAEKKLISPNSSVGSSNCLVINSSGVRVSLGAPNLLC